MDGNHEGSDQFKKVDKGTKFYTDILRRIETKQMRCISGPRYTFSSTIVHTTPLLKDLYQYITPQYAADWEVIGTLLGLPSGELRTIKAGNPTDVKCCCNQMWIHWLQVDTTASWGKLFTVIESPAVSYSAPDKGDWLCE